MSSAIEYEVQGFYASAWEPVTTEDTRKDATARAHEYRQNEPETAFRIVKVTATRT